LVKCLSKYISNIKSSASKTQVFTKSVYNKFVDFDDIHIMKLLRKIFIINQNHSKRLLIKFIFIWRKKNILLKQKLLVNSSSSKPLIPTDSSMKYHKNNYNSNNTKTNQNVDNYNFCNQLSSPDKYEPIATFSPNSSKALYLVDLNIKNSIDLKTQRNKHNSNKNVNIFVSKKNNQCVKRQLSSNKNKNYENNYNLDIDKKLTSQRRTK